MQVFRKNMQNGFTFRSRARPGSKASTRAVTCVAGHYYRADSFQIPVASAMPDKDVRYRSVIETTPDMVVIMDARGIIIAANRAVKRILGYEPANLIGQPLSRLMPEAYRARHVEGLARYLATGKRNLDWSSIQLPALDSNDCEIPVDISFGEFEENGQRFFTGILRDARAARKAADILEFLARAGPALAGSVLDYEETLQALTRLAVPYLADWCAVDIRGENGEIRRLAVSHADPAKVELASELDRRYPTTPDTPMGVPAVLRTGKSEFMEDLPSSLLENLARDDDHLSLIRQFGLRSYAIVPLEAHGRIYGALSLVQAESHRRFEASDIPLLEDLGRRAGMAVHNASVYRDATKANQRLEEQAVELEQQSEEAQALTEELEAQTRELTAALRDLEQQTLEAETANKAKSEFLATMSHELRTPLNAIGGYVELLLLGIRGPLTPEQTADLERIKAGARHLLGLINDLLNYAKLDAGKVDYRIQRLSIEAAISETEGMILLQLESNGLRYVREDCGENTTVIADPEKLRQILLNLLSNASRFTLEGGTVTVSCESQPGTVSVKVRDTGVGIPAEMIDQIFEPFVQVDRGLNRPGQGAGLGLAISRSLARGMGGDISVESQPGTGSIFSLRLPS